VRPVPPVPNWGPKAAFRKSTDISDPRDLPKRSVIAWSTPTAPSGGNSTNADQNPPTMDQSTPHAHARKQDPDRRPEHDRAQPTATVGRTATMWGDHLAAV